MVNISDISVSCRLAKFALDVRSSSPLGLNASKSNVKKSLLNVSEVNMLNHDTLRYPVECNQLFGLHSLCTAVKVEFIYIFRSPNA